MMQFEITNQLSGILQLFTDLCPQWESAISNQINDTRIKIINNTSCITIYFGIDNNANYVQTTIKMPIEIILGTVAFPIENTFLVGGYSVLEPCLLHVEDKNTIAIRLYFNKGIIDELEIYSLFNTEMDIQSALLKSRTYIIHDKQLYKALREDRGRSVSSSKANE